MRLGHPSMRRLQRWLEGEEEGLDGHLATCERCAARLDEVGAPDAAVGAALVELLRPPDQLTERLQGSIDERMRAREDLTLFTELFGLPIRAVRVMTTTQGET